MISLLISLLKNANILTFHSSENTSTNRACKQFVITEINKILLVIIID